MIIKKMLLFSLFTCRLRRHWFEIGLIFSPSTLSLIYTHCIHTCTIIHLYYWRGSFWCFFYSLAKKLQCFLVIYNQHGNNCIKYPLFLSLSSSYFCFWDSTFKLNITWHCSIPSLRENVTFFQEISINGKSKQQICYDQRLVHVSLNDK